jgi:hypothetical protein
VVDVEMLLGKTPALLPVVPTPITNANNLGFDIGG